MLESKIAYDFIPQPDKPGDNRHFFLLRRSLEVGPGEHVTLNYPGEFTEEEASRLKQIQNEYTSGL